MSDRVLYWGSGSVPAWRILVTLHAKKLEFTSKMVEFSKSVRTPSFSIKSTAECTSALAVDCTDVDVERFPQAQ
jgi:hypothetical protein